MSRLSDFVESIRELVLKSDGPKFTKPPGEPAHVYCYQLKDNVGTVVFKQSDPTPRDHDFHNLNSFTDEAMATSKAMPSARIWVGIQQCVLIYDDQTRRDRGVLHVGLSQQFEFIEKMSGKPYNQKQIITALRTSLARALPDATSEALLVALRSIRFRTESETASDIQSDKSSLGKSLRQEIASSAGAAKIPESVTLRVPVLKPPFEIVHVADIPCVIEVDIEKETFTITAIPGELEQAKCLAVNALFKCIVDELGESTIPVSIGCND